ncbi:MAG: thymidylate kinase [Candidatus Sulfotelmatobacter sp.]|nr:thymidylate kinase [Candidatus Sulfotelmatobacter sp.]
MKILSFSGIDGAGKSTQIGELQAWLDRAGQRTQLLTFWDNVVVGASFREFMSHKAFKGDRGIGSPEKPLHRRDKNVTSSPVTALRFCLYFADAVNVCRKVRSLRKQDVDVVIFDRYIYDELANLPLSGRLTRLFIRFVLAFVPQPDVAYVIDADPAAAFARKPEYPADFLRKNREAYLTFSRLSGHMTVIEPLPVEEATIRVREAFLSKMPEPQAEFSGLPALP